MSEAEIPAEYVTLVQVLAEDDALRRWFATLAVLPANRRYSELGNLSRQLNAAGEASLAQVILSLNEERIYRMVSEVIRLNRHGSP
ncbi:MAG TPA: hypothetical protein VGE50_01930 [Gammaproteobacteria bacterium]